MEPVHLTATSTSVPGPVLPPPGRGALPSRFIALDLFRGLAALWVFAFHFHGDVWFCQEHPQVQQKHAVLCRFLDMGDRGVPMFFVISGYCLAMAAARARKTGESVFSFIYRRAKRIYPTFWCSIVLILLIRHGHVPYRGWDWVKIVSLTRIFDPQAGIFFARFGDINGAYWTLAIEFQFYLIVAVALMARRWFYPLLAIVTLSSLVVYVRPDLWFPVAEAGIFLPWWTWFACGLLLYWILDRGWGPGRVFGKYASAASLGGIAMVLAAVAITLVRGGEIACLAFAAGFTVLLWFISNLDGAVGEMVQGRRWLPAPIGKGLATLGAMSYSLYLVHNELSALLTRAVKHTVRQGNWITDILIVAGTLVLCYPFYRCCEAPLLAPRRKDVQGPRSQQPGQGAQMQAPAPTARAA